MGVPRRLCVSGVARPSVAHPVAAAPRLGRERERAEAELACERERECEALAEARRSFWKRWLGP